MTRAAAPGSPEALPPLRRSVFWKVALILVGVQVATGLLAVMLSAWYASGRSRTLAANGLRLRLDALAEEVEQRGGGLQDGLEDLPLPLRIDLGARFPDPVILLGPDGELLETIAPGTSAADSAEAEDLATLALPRGLADALAEGDIRLQVSPEQPSGTWGLAPVYDRDGLLAGGLLVQPLTRSLARELAGTREAYTRALVVTIALAVVIALLLGAFFTLQLVRPLRDVTQQVERIGAGDYAVRVSERRDDEFGRLARSVNSMAAAVQTSIDTLRATDTLRRELIANVGHDLRTPLTALLGYVEEAERYLAAQELNSAHEALATATRQGLYLKQLVDDLFELSLLDSAAPPLRREPILLAELLTDAARAHRAAFQKAGLDFEIILPPALPVFEGDGVRLLRIIDNLLVNARQHTPPGGTVLLRAEVDGKEVRVAVEDTGRGMAPEVLAHVFDRHYRGEGARTHRPHGTGLGLPISRAIARAHGGDLVAESQAGQGSTFTLLLPHPGHA